MLYQCETGTTNRDRVLYRLARLIVAVRYFVGLNLSGCSSVAFITFRYLNENGSLLKYILWKLLPFPCRYVL